MAVGSNRSRRLPDLDPVGRGISETLAIIRAGEIVANSLSISALNVNIQYNLPGQHPSCGETDKMPSSILENGKLKPGIYRIQNLAGQTYAEMQESVRQLCGRPATALSTGDGLVRFSALVPNPEDCHV